MRIELVPLYRDIGMHTRYTAVNIALLVLGLLLAIADFAWTGLVLQTVHGPDRGWPRVAVDSLALITALAILSMLAACRWPKLASTVLWTLTFFFFVDIVGLHVFLPLLIPAILLAVTSALASLVEHWSANPLPAKDEK
jgi:hypothetical protein